MTTPNKKMDNVETCEREIQQVQNKQKNQNPAADYRNQQNESGTNKPNSSDNLTNNVNEKEEDSPHKKEVIGKPGTSESVEHSGQSLYGQKSRESQSAESLASTPKKINESRGQENLADAGRKSGQQSQTASITDYEKGKANPKKVMNDS